MAGSFHHWLFQYELSNFTVACRGAVIYMSGETEAQEGEVSMALGVTTSGSKAPMSSP